MHNVFLSTADLHKLCAPGSRYAADSDLCMNTSSQLQGRRKCVLHCVELLCILDWIVNCKARYAKMAAHSNYVSEIRLRRCYFEAHMCLSTQNLTASLNGVSAMTV